MIGKYQNTFFRQVFSSVAILDIIANFCTIELVESTNRAFLKVYVLSPMI
jgi:hypothetical protein